jgi:hypothetical protein
MAGEVASTLLSRMAVPVLYYMAERPARGEAPVAGPPHPSLLPPPGEEDEVEGGQSLKEA